MPKWLAALAALAVVAFAVWRLLPGTQSPTVVVYVSHDQVFSEPILKDFEKETGIKVRAVYDTEETKSTGTMNRLIAEKDNPQADVYWANEPIRAEVLRQQGIAAPYIRRTQKVFLEASRIPMATGRASRRGLAFSSSTRMRALSPIDPRIRRPAMARQDGHRKPSLRHYDDRDRCALCSLGR